MAKNSNLHAANRAKKDEFYTQLVDIENELKHYREHFVGKTIFCNCNDSITSNFFVYFSQNFEFLGLKRLIATSYTAYNQEVRAVCFDYRGDKNNNHMPDENEIVQYELIGNGDFRSEECIELLKEADIIVTNPPFSLFREYIAQLFEYNKKFLIIGNINATTYKEIFHLIKDNKLWLGQSIHSGDREFGVPKDYPLNAAGYRIDNSGQKYIRVKGVRWYTNLDYTTRHEDIILYKKYTPEEYPKYDNYDAINVNKTAEIPYDYNGVMGVPITFLDKYNPEQFELVKFRKGDDDKDLSINGKCPYFRILIKKRR